MTPDQARAELLKRQKQGKVPASGKGGAGYGRKKEAARARNAELSRDGRGITIRPVKDQTRKDSCEHDLERFCSTYFPARFPLSFCDAHRTAMRSMERCTHSGGLFCLAMPRGSGKTTIAEVEILRAILYGHRRFCVLVQATQPLAARSLKKLQRELESNYLLAEDFPEACDPIRALEQIHNRAKGQTWNGEPTRIEWTAEGIMLPRVKGSKSSGAVIHVTGLTGAVRGLTVSGPDGELLRPDMVLIDDAQTRDSAKSPTQTKDREAIVTDDILGLAGPKTTIAAVNLCTPIYPNDLAERFLSAEKHPEWQGNRTKMLEAMPTDMNLWDEYAEIQRESLRTGNQGERATEFYLANRAAMDAGAVASWPDRFKAGEASAIQCAMNLYYANPRGFAAEYQCQPEERDMASGTKELNAEAVASKLSGIPRYEVPDDASRVTAFIDVGGGIHWYCIVAWDERFNGSVIDYGCWPRQNRQHFAASDARPTLASEFPAMNESQRVFAGLTGLVGVILGRKYYRSVTGTEISIDRVLIDSGWQTDTVYQFCRQSPYSAQITPSKGVGRSATSVGVAKWKARPGERSGMHWRLTAGMSGKGRSLQFDPDNWKTFTWERLVSPAGGAGSLSLYGKSAAPHAMFGEHCAAEYASPVTMRGETWDKWEVRPDRPDNHLFDTLVGATVAASLEGLQWSASGAPTIRKMLPQKVKLSELQAKKRAGVG